MEKLDEFIWMKQKDYTRAINSQTKTNYIRC